MSVTTVIVPEQHGFAYNVRTLFRSDTDMTDKARRYMFWVGLYCLLMGLACVFRADDVRTPSFEIIAQVNPFGMAGWGYVHLVVAATALFACARQAPIMATLALMGVAGLAFPWAVGFALAYETVPNSSPAGVIIFLIWAIVNVDQSRNPLTAPMERVVNSLVDSSAGGDKESPQKG